MKFWLLTDSESGSEASDFENDFEEEEEEEDQHHHQQEQEASADRKTGCNKWWITNLRTASRKEHKSSFCPVQQKV